MRKTEAESGAAWGNQRRPAPPRPRIAPESPSPSHVQDMAGFTNQIGGKSLPPNRSQQIWAVPGSKQPTPSICQQVGAAVDVKWIFGKSGRRE